MKRFAVLLAVVCLVVAGFGVFAGTGKLSPVNTEHKPYVSYPSFPELKNYRFMLSSYQNRVAQGDNPVPVFGSSELNPRRANSKFHMVTLFRQNNYGMDVMAMGRGSIVNLWDAIEIGALSGQLQDKRVVIMPSMQWFMCYRNPQASFPATFSVGAWRALMENSAVSDSTKDEIRQTMASEYGVNRTDAGLGLSGLVDGIDDTVGQTVSDIQLKHLLRHPKEGGADFVSGMPHALTETQRSHASGQEQIPDWKNIFAQADAAARKKSGQNPYGFYHKWYGKGKPFKTWVKGARASWGFKEGKPYSDSEYRAFELVLEVCRETGVEPLVILQPSKGVAYDKTIYGKDVRAKYYKRMRAICKKYGAQCADFSNHEYDPYFFYDYTHPSALGDAYYSQAIYQFMHDEPLRQGPC